MARRRQTSTTAFSDINITPLMDLTFLLLIVFMITAPMMEFSVDVSPPELNANPLDETETLMLMLDADGNVKIGDRRVAMEELAAELAKKYAAMPNMPVSIRGDEKRSYGEVVAVMRQAYKAGFQNVALVTTAEEQ